VASAARYRYIGDWLARVDQFGGWYGEEVSRTPAREEKGRGGMGEKKRKYEKLKEKGESRGRGRTCARAGSRMGGCYLGVKEEKIGRTCGVAGPCLGWVEEPRALCVAVAGVGGKPK